MDLDRLPHIPLALYGSAIGVILSFCNNSSYARWWEARDNTVFDVPLTAIATTIEINLRQMLGETVLPQSEQPVRGVLW